MKANESKEKSVASIKMFRPLGLGLAAAVFALGCLPVWADDGRGKTTITSKPTWYLTSPGLRCCRTRTW